MPRRKKDGLLDVLAEIPWWINMILAGLVYAFLKFILPTIHFDSKIYQTITTALPNLAGIFAFLFLVGALLSFIGSLRRKKLLDNADKMESIRHLSWQEFELLVGEYFRRKGYTVTENGGGGADGGIDLILTKANQKTIVQCKRWKNVQVGVGTVRELYGVMAAEHASNCIFVSSGNYTQEALAFAQGKPVELIDGETLFKLVSSVRSNHPPNTLQQQSDINLQNISVACPKCGSPMVKRTTTKGSNAGKEFYGCSRYPSCKGIHNI